MPYKETLEHIKKRDCLMSIWAAQEAEVRKESPNHGAQIIDGMVPSGRVSEIKETQEIQNYFWVFSQVWEKLWFIVSQQM